MNVSNRFSIYCLECNDDVPLVVMSESNSYICPHCNHLYYEQDGVFDSELEEEMNSVYAYAELVGFIEDQEYREL